LHKYYIMKFPVSLHTRKRCMARSVNPELPDCWGFRHAGRSFAGAYGAGVVGVSALIRCFIEGLLRGGTPRVITDPNPANARAIRAYEKAVLQRERLVETPDGPALLMVLNA
jgi:hypothetical protein